MNHHVASSVIEWIYTTSTIVSQSAQQKQNSMVRPISTDLAGVAKDELNEDPSQLESHLSVIRNWLKECTRFHGVLDDQILLSFLRGCKFSLEKAKQKLSLFYWIRTTLPEVIQNRDPYEDHVLEVIRLGVGTPLPDTVKATDPKVFIIRVARFDLTKITFADVIKGGTLINDVLMRDDDQMVICGMILVIDLAAVTANHLFQFDFEFLKQVAILYQDASPLRMQGIHILNPPPGMQTAVNIFNNLLSAKNKNKRIFAHGSNLKSLHEHLPKEILPEEYGGTLGPIQAFVDEWELKLKANRDYLLEMANLRDNEASRGTMLSASQSFTSSPSSSLTSQQTYFGIDGSFRRLELD
ncbi:alpha-tocopherol transfer protein-like [Armigeres subalbatus]|uniref:alpha-tocopherol transfer protein-like n=1 Tax=Armigeres subalbatus TaxID=124917 RepID=UPI002ED14433